MQNPHLAPSMQHSLQRMKAIEQLEHMEVDCEKEVKAFALRCDRRLKQFVKYHKTGPDMEQLKIIFDDCVQKSMARLHPGLHAQFVMHSKQIIERWVKLSNAAAGEQESSDD